MCAVLGLAFGFGIMLLEFIPIVFCLGAAPSSAVGMVELAVRMCLHSRLLARSRRLRQEVFKDKNEEGYIRYSEASYGIDDKTGCQFQDEQTVAG